MPIALITGVTGQDGSFLAELLLSKGYRVHGTMRRSSSFNTARIDHIFKDLHLHYSDMTDAGSLNEIVQSIQPDEVYNLAAQSHVKTSTEIPEYTSNVNALGTLRLLEAVRKHAPQSKFYQASSSEQFGNAGSPQDENTPMHPRSPYGVSKLFAHRLTVNYRESYGMFAVNGILFNHESHRRGATFVTQKIVKGLAEIHYGTQKELVLGNLDAQRDWGWAPEYVKAMWLMLQQEKADDFVIATGGTYSVRDFLNEAASYLGMDWNKYVRIDSRYFRPAEIDILRGNATKATRVLGWRPRVTFSQLVRRMVDAEVRRFHDRSF